MSAVLAAFSTALVVTGSAILPGLELFCINQGEFTFSMSRLLLISALAGGIALLFLCLLLLVFRNSKHYDALNALLLAAGTTIWLQYVFFSQSMPELEPSWFALSPIIGLLLLGNLFLVLLPSFLIFWQKNWCRQHYWQLALIILAPQMISTIRTMAASSKPEYNFYEYSIAEDTKFLFAKDENIVILVVDSMGEFIFRQVWQSFPDLQPTLKDFTCFDRMVSPIPFTSNAVPALLTGVNAQSIPKNENENSNDHAEYLKAACWSENSLFLNFKKLGYHTDAYPFNLKTVSYDPALLDNVVLRENHQQSQQLFLDILFFRFTPLFLKPLLKNPYLSLTDQFVIPAKDNLAVQNRSHDPVFYQQLDSTIEAGSFSKGLKYLHIKGAHHPVCTDENLQISSGTNVVRQLRGSLKILELLIKKMKALGIYDQAMIVVAGDHSERYSPEIVALMKRPGETHESMQFNSLPCQISDIAGTVLAEKKLRPASLSLFSARPVSDPGKTRSEEQSTVLQIESWYKKNDFPPASGDISNFTTLPFLTDEKNICIPTERNQPLPAAIGFRAELLDSGECWETALFSLTEHAGQTNYYQLIPRGLPDGSYLLLQVEKLISSISNYFLEDSPTETFRFCYLPQYLVLRNGQAAFSKNYTGLTARTMQINEKLIFEAMKPHPQLLLPDDCNLTMAGLLLTEGSVLEIRLPEITKTMTMMMEIKINISSAGTLELYDGHTLLKKKNIKWPNNEIFAMEFNLPQKLPPGQNLKFQFRFIRKLKNRDRQTVPKILLTSLLLKEKS